jgi:hypothetical protein
MVAHWERPSFFTSASPQNYITKPQSDLQSRFPSLARNSSQSGEAIAGA